MTGNTATGNTAPGNTAQGTGQARTAHVKLAPPPPVALVTGGATRVGACLAATLAARGYHVAIHYRHSAADAENTCAAIEADGGRATPFAADLAAPDMAADLAARVHASLGAIGCLVNNAAHFAYDHAETFDRAGWQAHIEPNLHAPLVLTQAVAAMLPDGHQGVVVNMLDERVWKLTPHFLSYTISKAGLWAATQSLALALAPRIRVNGIGPGPVLPAAGQSDAHFSRIRERTPLHDGAALAELGHALGFILDTPSMTGQMIALDGGQHLAWSPAERGPEPLG